jgi:sialate O-acetylesterase
MIPRMLPLALALLWCVPMANAAVSLPKVFSDHMVIQRDLPVHVWGKADPAEKVRVTFRGQTVETAADSLGFWSAYLPPAPAGVTPLELVVQATNTVTLRDIVVGDVWVASGQSNMEWPVKESVNAQAEIANASHPFIRLLTVEKRAAEYPMDDIDAKPWERCSPESVAEFSAVAYFFGRELHGKTGVPIGLIDSSWGGTPAVTWTSLRGIGSESALMPAIAEWATLNDETVRAQVRREQQLKAWSTAVEKAKSEGNAPPPRPWIPNENRVWRPAGLFNAMIAPITPFAIRGAIWYQGESDASPTRAPIYMRQMQTLIRDWRAQWGVGDFPFLYTQIANFKTQSQHWPALREAQRQTLDLNNTGMAVTIDIGDPNDIHPKNKQEVGRRLSLWARALAYGEKIEYSGPLLRQAVPEGPSLRLLFDHAAGLNAKTGTLAGFEVAGADRVFQSAEARIVGNAVVLSSPQVPAPRHARYAWTDNPDASLFNGEGLPASPFTTVR